MTCHSCLAYCCTTCISYTSFGKGFSPKKEWVYEAILYAASKDVLIVNAAGNDGKNMDVEKTFPNDSRDLVNEISDNVSQSNLTFTSGSATVVNLTTAYYTLNVLSVDANGNKSTRGYLLTNTRTNLNIGVSGSLQGCMPESLPIQISVTGTSGIEFNHPSSIYKINWGDNQVDSFTHCDLMSRRVGNTITLYHDYLNASCGQPNDRYRLEISIKSGILSQTSGANGTSSCAIQPTFPIETFAYIYRKPIAAFTSPAYACVNSSVTFSNTTTSGLNSNCADNADFTWTINGVVVQGPGLTRNLTHVFTSPGQYTIELTSNNYTCDPTTATRTICIEPIPAPAFDIMSGGVLATSICTGQILTLQDNSNMVGLVCKNPTYLWSVSPNSGFSFVGGTSASSTNPQIQFSVAGTYTITQQITNSCGTRTTSQTITVQGTPSVTFPNTSYIYCTLPNPSLTADFKLNPALLTSDMVFGSAGSANISEFLSSPSDLILSISNAVDIFVS